jgi:gamma-glutamyl hercynylcysteine S-oxide synthase
MEASTPRHPGARVLAHWLQDARRRTLALVDDLTDGQLLGPQLNIINPLLWEIGHIAWFQERWVLRRGGQPSAHVDADALYDSSAVAHDTRWDLPLPGRVDTQAYMARVLERVLKPLQQREPSPEEAYFLQLALFHEDMHAEAFLMTRQTLGYPRPAVLPAPTPLDAGPLPGDVALAGGTFALGASPREEFVFDNEKWSHPVVLRPFAIARAPVTQAAFAVFVEDDGYLRDDLWCPDGWRWRQEASARHPLYWERGGADDWRRRGFDRWLPLEPNRPVHHLNWYEADAYCRWSGRRLPTEAEWERAAVGPDVPKPRFPWGNALPGPEEAYLDGAAGGVADVAAAPAGEGPHGCRQLIGNIWEWTASPFLPFPGFRADPYREYSAPWFGDHMVLRGGCWATRARLLRATWRNFYRPERRDVWAGFRTCALP